MNVGRNAVLAAGWPEEVVGRDAGPAVRLVAAGGPLRGRRGDLRAVRHRGGRRRRVDDPGADARAPSARAPGQPFGPRMLGRYDERRWSRRASAPRSSPSAGGCPATQLDEIAVRSHAARPRRPDVGRVRRRARAGRRTVVADEGIRRGHHARDAGRAAPAFRADGVVTAGNSSQISDGAAALLVTTSEVAARHGWTPAGPAARVRHRRRRPGDHAHRADPGDRAGARPGRALASTTSTPSR